MGWSHAGQWQVGQRLPGRPSWNPSDVWIFLRRLLVFVNTVCLVCSSWVMTLVTVRLDLRFIAVYHWICCWQLWLILSSPVDSVHHWLFLHVCCRCCCLTMFWSYSVWNECVWCQVSGRAATTQYQPTNTCVKDLLYRSYCIRVTALWQTASSPDMLVVEFLSAFSSRSVK